MPSPVRRWVVQFPTGLSLDIPSLHSCSAARLRRPRRGDVPERSLSSAAGSALVKVQRGVSDQSPRTVTLWAVSRSPFTTSKPTFKILGQGYTPIDERMVFKVVKCSRTDAPYGEGAA